MNFTSALIRTPTGLFAAGGAIEYDGDFPSPPRWLRPRVPLESLPDAGLPVRRPLLTAWQNLARVPHSEPQLAGEILADALLILLATVPANSAPNRVPPPSPVSEPPSVPRASAAHPRAYRGTKTRPPKSKTPPARDWRPALCDRRRTQEILARLWPARRETMGKLAACGFAVAALEKLFASTAPPADVYAAFHHPDADAAKIAALPAAFAENLFWLFRGCEWETVVDALAFFMRADVRADAELQVAAMCLLAENPGPIGLAWAACVPDMPPESRDLFINAVRKSVGRSIDPRRWPADFLAELFRVLPATDIGDWLFATMKFLNAGGDIDYVRDALRLVEVVPFPLYWPHFECRPDYRSLPLLDVLSRLPADYCPSLPRDLWRACGKSATLTTLITETIAAPEPADVIHAKLNLLAAVQSLDVPPADARDWWRQLAGELPALVAALLDVPKTMRHNLGAWAVCDWLEDCRSAADLAARAPVMRRCLRRFFRADFKVGSWWQRVLQPIVRADDALRARLMAAPDASFRTLAAASFRDNDGWLVCNAFATMLAVKPDLTVDALADCPGEFVRTLKALGVFSEAVGRQILRECDEHPLMAAPFAELEPAELAAQIETLWRGLETAGFGDVPARPVPRALREFLAGHRRLSPQQIERHRQRILSRTSAIRLAVIRAGIDRQLLAGFDLATTDADSRADLDFALRMLRSSHRNRRAFRGFLRAWLAGDRQWVRRHPETRCWLKSAAVNMAPFEAGFSRRYVTADGREITLAVETDPFAVLKMGQLAGTCLGLGGGQDFAALAAVLDINKQVIFARDASGRFVARQLVAVATTGHLVPFPIYPAPAADVAAMFADFDAVLGNVIGAPLLPADADYKIAHIIAHHWYDDGAWAPEDRATAPLAGDFDKILRTVRR